jgi:site-specific recombinase XerC
LSSLFRPIDDTVTPQFSLNAILIVLSIIRDDQGVHAWMVVELALSTGLWVSEMTVMKIEEIDLKRGAYSVSSAHPQIFIPRAGRLSPIA